MTKNIFNKKHIWPVALLLLLLSFLKLVDYSIGGFSNMFTSEEKTVYNIDSVNTEYDSLFNGIDENIELLVKNRNESASETEIKSLIADVKVIKPTTSPNSNSFNTTSFNGSKYMLKKRYVFYLVTTPGFVTNVRGAVDYYLPGGVDNRYYYEIDLKEGVYSFITMGVTPQDTVPFAIDKTGVYKLGFQEDHPNFIVYKDSLR